jgi:regulatory protein
MMIEQNRSAYSLALRALAMRTRSITEIIDRLRQKGFSEQVVSQVVDRLIDEQYLDDSRFADEWISSRSVNRYYGRRKLLSELRHKGVSSEIAETALAKNLPYEREKEIARSAARKRLKNLKGKGRDRKAVLYRYLMSKGFTSQSVWAAIDAVSYEEDFS